MPRSVGFNLLCNWSFNLLNLYTLEVVSERIKPFNFFLQAFDLSGKVINHFIFFFQRFCVVGRVCDKFLVFGDICKKVKPHQLHSTFCISLKEIKFLTLSPEFFEKFERNPKKVFFWKNGILK